MGCCSSRPLVEPSTACRSTATSRAGSTHPSRGAPELGRSSLALAALPTRHGSSGSRSSSSSSRSDSCGGYSTDEDSVLGTVTGSVASTVPLSTAQGGEQEQAEDGEGGGALPYQRRALASIKTTYRLRVGVLEGTTFLNQYIVVGTLGRGSFGKVKLCLNTGDDTLYAVKVVNTRALHAANKSRLRMRLGPLARRGAGGNNSLLPSSSAAAAAAGGGGATAGGPTASSSSAELPDLRREVEVMRALDHPNLVRLLEVIEDKEGGKVLMVMEYAEGGAIVGPATLTPDRHLPEAMAQYYFRQMAAGLAYLHEHHVVHGDLKPENVMLCGGGTVKIGDFGQSQFFDRRDTFNRTLGTPAYLAPEICAGEAYHGRQADVWALGVSLYLFIYGELPFKGASVLELYDAVAGCQEVPYPRHQPISHELQDLFLRLLHRDPRHRITAAEVLQHPWVYGSAWQALLPDMNSALDAAGASASATSAAATAGGSPPGSAWQSNELAADQEGGSSQQHPRAAFSAEDVAAVVFPDIAAAQQSELSGGSPRSPGGRTQLVDALAAAATASSHEEMAARLAHSPRQRLHKLTQDSMLRRRHGHGGGGGREQDGEGGGEKEEHDGRVGSGGAGSSRAQPGPLCSAAPATAGRDGAQQQREEDGDEEALHDREQGRRRQAAAAFSVPSARQRSVTAEEGHRLLPPSPFGGPARSAEPRRRQAAERAANGGGGGPWGQSRVGEQQGQHHQQQVEIEEEGGDMPRRRSFSALRSIFAGPADFVAAGHGAAAGTEPLPRRRSSLDCSRSQLGALGSTAAGDVGGSEGGGRPGADGLVRASSADQPVRPGGAARLRGAAQGLFAGVSDFVEGMNGAVPGPASGLPPRLPPRAPPSKPNGQQPMVINIFKPGERLGMASSTSQQHTCFYIEQGVVEVRYEADVPVTLSSVLSAATSLFRRATAAAAAASAAAAVPQVPQTSPLAGVHSPDAGPRSPAGSAASPTAAFAAAAVAAAQAQQQGQAQQGQGQGAVAAPAAPAAPSPSSAAVAAQCGVSPRAPLAAEDQADSSVHGSHVFDLGVPAEMEQQGSELMERSQTLAETVAQATLRAKALLASASAKGGSLDHLLVCERTTGEFLGSLAMLDTHFLLGRWKATAVARTHVVALHMTREGLEQFLQQHPLAQVYLRASMARARAEVVKLEALEKIAVARQHQAQFQERRSRPRSQRGSASGAATPLPRMQRAGSGGSTPGGLPPPRPALPPLPPAAAAVAAAAAGVPPEGSVAPGVAPPAGGAPKAVVALPATAHAAAAAAAGEGAAGPATPRPLAEEGEGEQAAAGVAEPPLVAPGAVAEGQGIEAAEQTKEEEEEQQQKEEGKVTAESEAESRGESAAESEGESEAKSVASAASSGSSLGMPPPPRMAGPRRSSGVSTEDAFSSTLELFRVVSQLRDAISQQLQERVEQRGAGGGSGGEGGRTVLLAAAGSAGGAGSGGKMQQD